MRIHRVLFAHHTDQLLARDGGHARDADLRADQNAAFGQVLVLARISVQQQQDASADRANVLRARTQTLVLDVGKSGRQLLDCIAQGTGRPLAIADPRFHRAGQCRISGDLGIGVEQLAGCARVDMSVTLGVVAELGDHVAHCLVECDDLGFDILDFPISNLIEIGGFGGWDRDPDGDPRCCRHAAQWYSGRRSCAVAHGQLARRAVHDSCQLRRDGDRKRFFLLGELARAGGLYRDHPHQLRQVQQRRSQERAVALLAGNREVHVARIVLGVRHQQWPPLCPDGAHQALAERQPHLADRFGCQSLGGGQHQRSVAWIDQVDRTLIDFQCLAHAVDDDRQRGIHVGRVGRGLNDVLERF